MLAGGAGLLNSLPPSIQKAFAIDPIAGSTFLDAEHVVILMQENRSFDHCYGSLSGVRGFNDPRVITLPDKDLVWVQKNAAGEGYLPFRLDIKNTNSTWTGSLPHSWTNQVDARNNGRYDQWLIAKPSGHKAFAAAPLTMGFYNREDIPFYYSLADAFTVCDQNFCSSLTGTTPNRLFLWTGTVRGEKNAEAPANVRNEDADYTAEVNWKTFPERLEENNISWKIYQNEISLQSGFEGEEDAWLSNFTDNPIEWFSQYHVRFSKGYRAYLIRNAEALPVKIAAIITQMADASLKPEDLGKKEKEVQQLQALLKQVTEEKEKWSEENFEKLSEHEKNIHRKAFTTNSNDPFYRQLDSFQYTDGNEKREMQLPKGDVLHQFRNDVETGSLPAVSWLVSPENFSDHPGAPWYGAWYVSEVMDILTKNPSTWKKTIFILCYDENDGYFDHVPPYVAPDPAKAHSGLVSKGIDTSVEHVTLAQDMKRKPQKDARASSIGLGYRVPLVIASPWSRGGAVCSQVFDHTSILQLLEKIFSHKLGKKIEESNITQWRRTVCGDLSAVFHEYDNKKSTLKTIPEKEEFMESVHKSKFKRDPAGYQVLTKDEIKQVNNSPFSSGLMPRQEKGVRPSCPLPYQLNANGQLNAAKDTFEIQLEAGSELFGSRSAGSPFIIYAPDKYDNGSHVFECCRSWNYAVAAGDRLQDNWPIDNFENNKYDLTVYGPNGFFRAFTGTRKDPVLDILFDYEREKNNTKKLTGNVHLMFTHSNPADSATVYIKDNTYKTPGHRIVPGSLSRQVILDLSKSANWYDFTITISGNADFSRRYAGHVETGTLSQTDPAMGGMV